MPERIAAYSMMLTEQLKHENLILKAEHYYTHLRNLKFNQAKLNRLSPKQLHDLYKSANFLMTQGYTTAHLSRFNMHSESDFGLFNLVRLHKILIILNHQEPIADNVQKILRSNRNPDKKTLLTIIKSISMLTDHNKTRMKNTSITELINQLLTFLRINKSFDSRFENDFLFYFKTKGTGQPMPFDVTVTTIPTQAFFSAINTSWLFEEDHTLSLSYIEPEDAPFSPTTKASL